MCMNALSTSNPYSRRFARGAPQPLSNNPYGPLPNGGNMAAPMPRQVGLGSYMGAQQGSPPPEAVAKLVQAMRGARG
ncbi:hypothetical protein UFOVP1165_49 [uncultured Caudovirales phage]|uniref:Uncharacterized protein n=1 Tax=uncultured Caudovirales phage TaxID=2100421 RepID=A0A6J5R0J5_9CAUD|nr:hypothetical protein UFOVP1165_49 [uncultured Caudovirales phage]